MRWPAGRVRTAGTVLADPSERRTGCGARCWRRVVQRCVPDRSSTMRLRPFVLCVATAVAVLLLAPTAGATRTPSVPRCPTAPSQAGASWSKADLHDCDLTGFSFVGANLNKASLDGADLTNADVTGANLNKVTCVGTIVTGMTGGPLPCTGFVVVPPLAPHVLAPTDYGT